MGLKIVFGVIAEAADGAARAVGVVERAAVVVAHLNEDVIAGFGIGEHFVPPTLRDEGAAAAAAERVVFDADFFVVKIFADEIAPAAFAAGKVVDSGIADDEEDGIGAIGVGDETARGVVARGVHIGGVLRGNLRGGLQGEGGEDKQEEFGHRRLR